MENMRQKMMEVFAQALEVDPASIKEGMLLEEIPGWDSMMFVMALSGLEEELGISIPLEDAARMRTVSELLAYADGQGGR